MRLHKALYGLRQAARAWNEVLCEMLTALILRNRSYEESLYTRNKAKGDPIFLVNYVDEMRIVVKHDEVMRLVDAQIEAQLELRVADSVKKFMGM